MTSQYTILLLAIITLCSCRPRLSLDEQMQRVLDNGIRKHDIHGVSAAVIFPDDSVWTGVSGTSHDSIAMAPDMVFAIGSITKNVVAALALKLAEEGVLSLDDPLSKWLPGYRHVNETITIRQLLSHTSGLYMFWDNQQIWDDLLADRTRIWTPEEVLSYIKEPYFAPGDGFRYSNTNYLLVAMIIEKATGSTLAAQLRSRLWQPLGIDNAWLWLQEEIQATQAHVYGDNFVFGQKEADITFEPRASHESIAFGSSGVFTTAESLARWSQALFGGDVLQPSSLDEMLHMKAFKPFANMSG